MGATIRELSKRCGLSVSAVSKALNNYPDVSEKTRALVLKTAQEMGYYPNALARGLKTNRTFNLGVILDDKTSDSLLHDFFIVILNGFKREAELRGYDITLINRNLGGQNLTYLNHCRYRNVDGVCIMCVDFAMPDIAELAGGDVPCVSVDHPFPNRECVLSDNHAGINALLDYIVSRGHRRVAFTHGEHSNVTDARVAAFLEAAQRLALHIPDAYINEVTYRSTSAQHAVVQKLLALPEPPTCIMMADDYSALGGIDAIKEAGLRIPEDISVVGYDGTALIQKIHPRLTTLKQDGEEMGRRAAIRLIERIEKPDAPMEQPDVVPGRLLTGETVADIN